MTLSEIAYNIKNIVEGGISGDDSNLSLSQIKHMIHYHRAQLLTKYTDSGRFISDAMLQTVSGPNTAALTVPKILGWPKNRAIKEVLLEQSNNSGVNTIYNLPIILPSERDFFLATQFAPNENHYFCVYNANSNVNNTVQVLTSDGSPYTNSSQTIIVRAVFENPTDIAGGSSSYAVPSELVGSLVESILAKEFNVYLKTSPDNINDSIDTASGKSPAANIPASPNANARARQDRTR